jgi:hypothetical protein
MTSTSQYLELTGDSKKLLTIVVPNELLNGFKINEFERVVGISKDGFRAMRIAFQSEPNLALKPEQALVLRNALNAVMIELNSEFQTRTGYELSRAAEVLLQLDAFIASQGVL